MADLIDPETGLEFYFWRGQKRYRCPTQWEAGCKCHFDHYDPQVVKDHSKGPHTAMGQPAKVQAPRKVTSSIVDISGKRMMYELPTDPDSDLNDIHFKK